MILVATRILRGRASQEILTPLVQVDRWIFVTDTLTGSTETYNTEHIQSPVRQGMKGIPSYICLLRYPVVFPSEPGRNSPANFGSQLAFVGTEFRTVVGRERDDEISGAEQSYQPFVGINHPIQPGDWHSTAPCSGLFVECLISLVFGRCQKCYAFKWPCGIFTYMSLAKQTNGCLGYLGDEMLPSYVGIIINYHYTDKPDPRHPNTSWAGIWTPNTYPKHLLRSCLDVYGNIIFLILILSNWKWSRKKPFPRFPTVFGSINPLPTTKKLLQQNRFQSRENTRTTLNH